MELVTYVLRFLYFTVFRVTYILLSNCH